MKYFFSSRNVESGSKIDFYWEGLDCSNWFSRTFVDANYFESFYTIFYCFIENILICENNYYSFWFFKSYCFILLFPFLIILLSIYMLLVFLKELC